MRHFRNLLSTCLVFMLMAGSVGLYASDRMKQGPGGNYTNQSANDTIFFDSGDDSEVLASVSRHNTQCGRYTNHAEVRISGGCEFDGQFDQAPSIDNGNGCNLRQVVETIRMLPGSVQRCEVNISAFWEWRFLWFTDSEENNWTEIWKVNQQVQFNDSHVSGERSAGQAVTLDAIAMTVGQGATQTGQSVSYQSLSTGVCTVSGNSVNQIAEGQCIIRASVAETAHLGSATSQHSWQVTDPKQNQTITIVNAAPANALVGETFTVSATASSGLSVLIDTSGQCSGSGSNSAFVEMTGAGSCYITYNQPGNANYNPAAEIQETVSISKNSQAITVTQVAPGSAHPGDSFTVVAEASSGLPVSITTSGQCTGSGNNSASIDILGEGSCTIYYNQSGNAVFLAAPEVTESINISKVGQTITVTGPAPANAYPNDTFVVTAEASSGLPVSITTSGQCTGSGSNSANIEITGEGSCTISYNQPGDAVYLAAPEVTEMVNIGKVPQTITVTLSAPSSAISLQIFEVEASASSGLPVDITVTGQCSLINGGTNSARIRMNFSGGCNVQYNQPGDDVYAPADEVVEFVTINKASQNITVTESAPATALGGDVFEVEAEASSGLPVSIDVSGTCAIVSGGSEEAEIEITGVGTCTISYNQPGDASYHPAPEVQEQVTTDKASQSIDIDESAPATALGGDQFTVEAEASSGLPVSISATGTCSVIAGGSDMAEIEITGLGTCTIDYEQPGNDAFDAAAPVTEVVNIADKSDQSISLTQPAPANAAVETGFTVVASASSGLDVSIAASGSCQMTAGGTNSAEIYVNSEGDCTIQYNQPGNEAYNPAPERVETVITAMLNQTINVTTPPPTGAGVGDVFTVSAVASSGLGVNIATSGSCSIYAGGLGSADILVASSGVCTVTFNQSGNSSYNSAPEVEHTVDASKLSQTINVTSPAPSNAETDSTFDVAANASSGLPVTITASDNCFVSVPGTNPATIEITGNAGICTVTYSQDGNGVYNSADEIIETVDITKLNQSIDIKKSAPEEGNKNDLVEVFATASSGLLVNISVEGQCTINNLTGDGGASIDLTDVGECKVYYNQAGNTTYEPAPELIETIMIAGQKQSITVQQSAPEHESVGAEFTVNAIANSGLDVLINVNAKCEIVSGGTSTATVRITDNSGTCRIFYNQPGNEDFLPAEQVVEETLIANITDGSDISHVWTTQKLFTTGIADNQPPQPITTPPAVARNPNIRAPYPNLMVMFGTGKYMELSDLPDTSLQSVYGVHDRGDYELDRYTEQAPGKKTLERRVYTEHAMTTVDGDEINNRKVEGEIIDWSVQYGWYADLASDLNNDDQLSGVELRGERMVFRPFLLNRLFVFSTIIPVTGSCSGATEGAFMAVDWTTGMVSSFPIFDATGDGVINADDMGFVGQIRDEAVSEMNVVIDTEGQPFLVDTTGGDTQTRAANPGPPTAPSFRLGWEEKQPFGVIINNDD